jgi:hypothetical protein
MKLGCSDSTGKVHALSAPFYPVFYFYFLTGCFYPDVNLRLRRTVAAACTCTQQRTDAEAAPRREENRDEDRMWSVAGGM